MISIKRIFASLAMGLAMGAKYDETEPIKDIRGGATLQVTYPPNVVDTLDGG